MPETAVCNGHLYGIYCIWENSEKAVTAAMEEVQRLDGLLSAQNENSKVYALNNRDVFKVSDDVSELIKRGKEIFQETDGLFDNTIYPVMQLWGFSTGEYHVPTKKEVQNVLTLVDGEK